MSRSTSWQGHVQDSWLYNEKWQCSTWTHNCHKKLKKMFGIAVSYPHPLQMVSNWILSEHLSNLVSHTHGCLCTNILVVIVLLVPTPPIHFFCGFSCFHNPPNSDMDYKIFNVRIRDHSYVRIHPGVGQTDSKRAQHFWLGKTVKLSSFCVCSQRSSKPHVFGPRVQRSTNWATPRHAFLTKQVSPPPPPPPPPTWNIHRQNTDLGQQQQKMGRQQQGQRQQNFRCWRPAPWWTFPPGLWRTDLWGRTHCVNFQFHSVCGKAKRAGHNMAATITVRLCNVTQENLMLNVCTQLHIILVITSNFNNHCKCPTPNVESKPKNASGCHIFTWSDSTFPNHNLSTTITWSWCLG